VRSSAAIQADIERLKERRDNLTEKITGLNEELRQAILSEKPVHPWLGKKVKQLHVGGFRRKSQMRRGTLTVYDPAKQRSYRYLYRPDVGDLIVVTDSGQSAYRFYTPEEIERIGTIGRSKEQPWELDE
jgi:DNA-binding transcriptional MerR regulator